MNNVQVKERPILFSGPMVRAILEGRKTQTRRVVKPLKTSGLIRWNPVILNGSGGWSDEHGSPIKCPYGKPGDRLYVRETWGVGTRPDPWQGCVDGVEYRADLEYLEDGDDLELNTEPDIDYSKYSGRGWRPSIHMPRAACRILLEITDIRAERLQDISEQDAIAEGVENFQWLDPHTEEIKPAFLNYMPTGYRSMMTAKASFESLWHSINGPESWNQNPFVWVVEFKKL